MGPCQCQVRANDLWHTQPPFSEASPTPLTNTAIRCYAVLLLFQFLSLRRVVKRGYIMPQIPDSGLFIDCSPPISKPK